MTTIESIDSVDLESVTGGEWKDIQWGANTKAALITGAGAAIPSAATGFLMGGPYGAGVGLGTGFLGAYGGSMINNTLNQWTAPAQPAQPAPQGIG